MGEVKQSSHLPSSWDNLLNLLRRLYAWAYQRFMPATRGPERRQLQSLGSFTILQQIEPDVNQTVSTFLKPPVFNTSHVASLLGMSESEISIGIPTVAGVVATLHVEQAGAPNAVVTNAFNSTSIAAAIGVDSDTVSQLEPAFTTTPPQPPPSPSPAQSPLPPATPTTCPSDDELVAGLLPELLPRFHQASPC